MLTVLSLRSPLDVSVLHDRNPLYVLLSDGSIRNGYDVKILNMTPQPRQIALTIDGLTGATMTLAGSSNSSDNKILLDVEPDRVLPIRLYIRANPDNLVASRTEFKLIATNVDGPETATAHANFETPEK
jgi:polyferredoxin